MFVWKWKLRVGRRLGTAGLHLCPNFLHGCDVALLNRVLELRKIGFADILMTTSLGYFAAPGAPG